MSFIKNGLPKVLIISHNCLSLNSNNGKTILSLFRQWPESRISQIFFRDEFPDFESDISYFAIRNSDIIKSLFFGSRSTGEIIHYRNTGKYSKSTLSRKRPLFYYTLRDLFWLLKKNQNKLLDSWLSNFQPDIIFFVAGNNTFSYDFALKLSKQREIPFVIYFTDDYIMPLKSQNLLDRFHLIRLKSRFLNSIQEAKIRFTIGSKMSNIYESVFNQKFIPVMNQVSLEDIIFEKYKHHAEVRLVYMGNLSLDRWKNLVSISEAIKKINLKGIECKLEIYSLETPSETILNSLNNPPYVTFLGSEHQKVKIYNILNQADLVIHTESFNEDMIEITHLSISTKISEYLALGKCIFAFGPPNIASIDFLMTNGLGIVCTDKNHLFQELFSIIQNKARIDQFGIQARLYYKNYMSIDLQKMFNELF